MKNNIITTVFLALMLMQQSVQASLRDQNIKIRKIYGHVRH